MATRCLLLNFDISSIFIGMNTFADSIIVIPHFHDHDVNIELRIDLSRD